MSKTNSKGLKFTEKYGVEAATIYKGDTESLKIPPPGHVLYDPTSPTTFDEIKVQEIDRTGKMTTALEVWTEPDTDTLWVVDGRSSLLDVREVNARRQARGRELVKPHIVPFPGTEKEAVMRVRIKNYHRRVPKPSHMAIDLRILRAQGCTWEECATTLHVLTEDPEQWGRKLLPLAYCIPEVQEAIDAGDISRKSAVRFGGSAPDGTKALGKKAQLALLAEMREEKPKKKAASKHVVAPRQRERLRAVLANGATQKLGADDRAVAGVARAVLARIDGDPKALSEWPEVEAIFNEALKPLPKGPRPKKSAE